MGNTKDIRRSEYGKAFDNVKSTLSSKGANVEKDEQLAKDAWVLMEKLEKVKQLSPELTGVEFGEEAGALIKLVGKKKLLSSYFKNRAASLL